MDFYRLIILVSLLYCANARDIIVFYNSTTSFKFFCPPLDLSNNAIPMLSLSSGVNLAVRSADKTLRVIKPPDWIKPSWDNVTESFKVEIMDIAQLGDQTVTCLSRDSHGFGSIVDQVDFKFILMGPLTPVEPEKHSSNVGVPIDDGYHAPNLTINCSFYSKTPNANVVISWFKESFSGNVTMEGSGGVSKGEKLVSSNLTVKVSDRSELARYHCRARLNISSANLDELTQLFGPEYVAQLKGNLDGLMAEQTIQLVEDQKPSISVSTKIIHTGYDVNESVYAEVSGHPVPDVACHPFLEEGEGEGAGKRFETRSVSNLTFRNANDLLVKGDDAVAARFSDDSQRRVRNIEGVNNWSSSTPGQKSLIMVPVGRVFMPLQEARSIDRAATHSREFLQRDEAVQEMPKEITYRCIAKNKYGLQESEAIKFTVVPSEIMLLSPAAAETSDFYNMVFKVYSGDKLKSLSARLRKRSLTLNETTEGAQSEEVIELGGSSLSPVIKYASDREPVQQGANLGGHEWFYQHVLMNLRDDSLYEVSEVKACNQYACSEAPVPFEFKTAPYTGSNNYKFHKIKSSLLKQTQYGNGAARERGVIGSTILAVLTALFVF